MKTLILVAAAITLCLAQFNDFSNMELNNIHEQELQLQERANRLTSDYDEEMNRIQQRFTELEQRENEINQQRSFR